MTPSRRRRPDDTIADFWSTWHARRAASGVSVNEIARQVNSNRTSIYDLGKKGKAKLFPEVGFVTKLCAALGMDDAEQQQWLSRYEALLAEETAEPARPRGPGWLPVVIAVVAAVSGSVATLLIGGTSQAVAPPPQAHAAVIEVQNMVVAGENELAEDSTPAYLSSRTVRRCAAAENACKLSGTEMSSGALLVAVCRAAGEELVNYNRDSPFPDNPYRVRSDRWYRVLWPDKREGYLSEVYVRPSDRDGRGLPDC